MRAVGLVALLVSGCVATSQDMLDAQAKQLEEQLAVTPQAILVRLQGVLELIPPGWDDPDDPAEPAQWEVLALEAPPFDDPDLPEDAPDFLMAIRSGEDVVYGVAVIEGLPTPAWPVLRWDDRGITVEAGNLRDFLADRLRTVAQRDDRRLAAQEAWLRLRLGLHFPDLLDERLAAARDHFADLEAATVREDPR